MEKVTVDTVREEKRHVAPAHYSMKIDSFSLLSEMVDNSYESREFEASGYKWKLVLYPNGDKSRNVDGYISLYLVMADTNGFPPGWEINVIVKFFVFDQLQDKYLTIGDGSLRRFSAIKNKWGLPQMLSLSIFNNASNGYLIGDSCVFGVEVFVIKNEGKGEHFSMIKDPSDGTFTWELYKALYGLKQAPKASFQRLSAFLLAQGFSHSQTNASLFIHRYSSCKIYVLVYVDDIIVTRSDLQCVHQFLDQLCSTFDSRRLVRKWFNASENDWGLTSFISLTDIKNQSNNFIINDTLIVEGVLNHLSVLKDFDGASLIRKED
ncbi:hypothetical protein DKX38_026689 [Salix brachista]|uniref:MATH domain-containing protein n=1 Tax=Salix brachista TaxID=2182728 RepID=A0A5N5JAB3_9ROSI|nr:hypothetical protein DKX38_026689 [Salix brachista]